MNEQQLKTIEQKVDSLINRCAELEAEISTLREQSHAWKNEKTILVEKNEMARTRVEAMITQLKSINNGATS